MKIFNNAILNKKYFNGVIAIGNFDGIHLGHQKVIKEEKNLSNFMIIKKSALSFFN